MAAAAGIVPLSLAPMRLCNGTCLFARRPLRAAIKLQCLHPIICSEGDRRWLRDRYALDREGHALQATSHRCHRSIGPGFQGGPVGSVKFR